MKCLMRSCVRTREGEQFKKGEICACVRTEGEMGRSSRIENFELNILKLGGGVGKQHGCVTLTSRKDKQGLHKSSNNVSHIHP